MKSIYEIRQTDKNEMRQEQHRHTDAVLAVDLTNYSAVSMAT